LQEPRLLIRNNLWLFDWFYRWIIIKIIVWPISKLIIFQLRILTFCKYIIFILFCDDLNFLFIFLIYLLSPLSKLCSYHCDNILLFYILNFFFMRWIDFFVYVPKTKIVIICIIWPGVRLCVVFFILTLIFQVTEMLFYNYYNYKLIYSPYQLCNMIFINKNVFYIFFLFLLRSVTKITTIVIYGCSLWIYLYLLFYIFFKMNTIVNFCRKWYYPKIILV
jgi:hypothetical protein